jgi:hypothetical protein
MAATAARIGFCMSEYRRVTATNQTVKDTYGALARESDDPIPTFFDNAADAQAVANARQALLQGVRRRFRTVCSNLSDVVNMDLASGVPVAAYVDPERDVSRLMLVSEVTFSFSKASAAFTVWG